MARRAVAIGLTMLLAGCGGGGSSSSTTTGSNTTITMGGEAAQAQVSDPLTAHGSNDCGKKPDFAPVYDGATILVCSSAHFDNTGKDGGTVIYSTPATPAQVLAWSKEQAVKSGLTPRISTDKMFSAGEGNKRTIMVFVRPDGAGTKVNVNYGMAP